MKNLNLTYKQRTFLFFLRYGGCLNLKEDSYRESFYSYYGANLNFSVENSTSLANSITSLEDIDWDKSSELRSDTFYAFDGTGNPSLVIPFTYQDIYTGNTLYKLAVADELTLNDLPLLMNEFLKEVSVEECILILKNRLKHSPDEIIYRFKNDIY